MTAAALIPAILIRNGTPVAARSDEVEMDAEEGGIRLIREDRETTRDAGSALLSGSRAAAAAARAGKQRFAETCSLALARSFIWSRARCSRAPLPRNSHYSWQTTTA